MNILEHMTDIDKDCYSPLPQGRYLIYGRLEHQEPWGNLNFYTVTVNGRQKLTKSANGYLTLPLDSVQQGHVVPEKYLLLSNK